MQCDFYSEEKVGKWNELQQKLWSVYSSDLNLFFLYMPNPFCDTAAHADADEVIMEKCYSLFRKFAGQNVVAGNWGLMSLLVNQPNLCGDQLYLRFALMLKNEKYDLGGIQPEERGAFVEFLQACSGIYKRVEDNSESQLLLREEIERAHGTKLDEYVEFFNVISNTLHMPADEMEEEP